jgi:hypothetical protein
MVCGDGKPLSFEIHPHVMDILQAAYAHSEPASKQPIRGFGWRDYGVRVVLPTETGKFEAWRVLGQMRDVGKGKEHGAVVTRFKDAYDEAAGRESVFIPFRSLVRAVVTVPEAYEVVA